MENFKQYINGLKLSVKQIPSVGSVALGVIVGVGSCLETEENNGYSHMVEHMLFKGTKKRTAKQISEQLDALGGNFNAFTGKESTCYYCKVLPNKLEEAAELLSDIFFNAIFNEDELERERKVIAEEIFMDEDMPEDVCHDLLSEAFYGEQSLGQKVIGKSENIANANSSDLIAFKRKYYVSNNTCISFAGCIDFETADRIVSKYFLNSFDDNSLDFKVQDIQRFTPKNKFLYRIKEVEQSHIAIAFESLSAENVNSIPFKLANIVFGGGMSSRLFQKIREENGLAYSVYSSLSAYVNNGYLELYVGTSPKNLKKAVSLLLEEIIRFEKYGLTGMEIDRAKTQLKTSLVFTCENPLGLMISYGICYLFFDKSFDMENKIQQVDKVSPSLATQCLLETLDLKTCSSVYVGKNCNDYEEPKRFINFNK